MKFGSFLFYALRPIKAIRRVHLAIHNKKHPDDPWLSQGSVEFLKSNLRSDMRVFEWGSGRSTTWFSKRCREIVSIEYDAQWADIVKKGIQDQKLSNVRLFYIPLEHPKSAPTPKDYDPTPQYVTKIFDYEKESFDLIIVDGHYRLTCVDKCLDYISPGGYLLIDNSNRVPRDEWVVPKSWAQVHESENVVTRTTLWQKPQTS